MLKPFNKLRNKRALWLIAAFAFVGLTGCAKPPNLYSPNDFVNPNQVVTQVVHDPMPTPTVHATFGYGNNPAVVRAYRNFSKTGKAQHIQSSGFVTRPYEAYSHPIISCEPLHLCVVQLEEGETINNIDLGDSADWLVSTARVGNAAERFLSNCDKAESV